MTLPAPSAPRYHRHPNGRVCRVEHATNHADIPTTLVLVLDPADHDQMVELTRAYVRQADDAAGVGVPGVTAMTAAVRSLADPDPDPDSEGDRLLSAAQAALAAYASYRRSHPGYRHPITRDDPDPDPDPVDWSGPDEPATPGATVYAAVEFADGKGLGRGLWARTISGPDNAVWVRLENDHPGVTAYWSDLRDVELPDPTPADPRR